jgi:hypothetical protein
MALATSFVFPTLPIGYNNKKGVVTDIKSIGYGSVVVDATLL